MDFGCGILRCATAGHLHLHPRARGTSVTVDRLTRATVRQVSLDAAHELSQCGHAGCEQKMYRYYADYILHSMVPNTSDKTHDM